MKPWKYELLERGNFGACIAAHLAYYSFPQLLVTGRLLVCPEFLLVLIYSNSVQFLLQIMSSQPLKTFFPPSSIPCFSCRLSCRLNHAFHGFQADISYNRFNSLFFFFSSPEYVLSFLQPKALFPLGINISHKQMHAGVNLWYANLCKIRTSVLPTW